ncbi:type I-E CRISPR-associated protein Cse1/CasA [Streptomyces sp. NPDC029674]|uniref:type I-E CRISPR-associated protein Cse1/CasA n=1 Tax=Streptomyces sp. NPDC029674 TaxID=3365297 RepID=UPI00384EE23D
MFSTCLVDGLGWLPVTASKDLSLREYLHRSHELTGLLGDVPTVAPAIRSQVLLPVVRHALADTLTYDTWAATLKAGRFFPEQLKAIDRYLDERLDRFRLFDEVRPFGQAAGLSHAKGEAKPSSLLVPVIDSGNNVPLWSGRTDGDPLPLTPAEAVRWMLHAQCWDTAGIKAAAVDDPQAAAGKTAGNQTGSLGSLGVVEVIGRTELETLLLNLPCTPLTEGDLPQWDREPQTQLWSSRPCTGILDRWTWPSRRIRLLPEQTESGALVIRQIILAAGDRCTTALTPDTEPRTCWGKKTEKKKEIVYPRRHRPSVAAWRGLEALVTLHREGSKHFETSLLLSQVADALADEDLPDDYPLRVALSGIEYGTQSSIVKDVLGDGIPLPVAALTADSDVREHVLKVVLQAETIARAITSLHQHLLQAVGGEAPPTGKGARAGDRILHAIDPYVRRFLAGCQRTPDSDLLTRVHLAYEKVLDRIARKEADSILRSLPSKAFTGRTRENTAGKTIVFRQAEAERFFYADLRKTLTYLYSDTPGPKAEDAA